MNDTGHSPTLKLEPGLQAILDQEYPRFSEAEYVRRHGLLAEAMARAGVDHLLVVSQQRTGNATQWVTGWPGTIEAYVIFKPGEGLVMDMEWYNHVPLAKRIARTTEVRWAEHRGIGKTIEELQRRGARRVGVIGPLKVSRYRQLEAHFGVVDLDQAYVQMRLVKSEEEIDWLRIGAAFSDAGFAALLAGTAPGLTERELGNLIERAYVGHGGTNMIHYIGRTSMARPNLFVPPQLPSSRRVEAGDVIFTEISAFFWDYAGQVLRTFSVGADPTPLYRDLHATAEAAFDAVTAAIRAGATMEEIVAAADGIGRSGFTICDDLVHGFGGGYFPPILGTRERPAGPLPDMVLEENMCVVVQPNVINPEHTAGVQLGELVRVTRTGCERLHRTPRGFFRKG